jgi:site-specific recombinase XerD
LNNDCLPVMHQPVDQGRCQSVVHAKEFAPFPEGTIRGDHDRSNIITGGDNLEQQIGTALVHGQIAQLISEAFYRDAKRTLARQPTVLREQQKELNRSAAKRNLHLSVLRGFFDRLVNRHVVILSPAASVKGIKELVVEGKTPEIGIEQARKLLASIDTGHVVGLRDQAILGTLAYNACRGGAVARLRLGDFQDDGQQYVLRFMEKGGKSREIPVRHDLEGFILAYVEAAGIATDAKESPLFRMGNGRTRKLSGNAMTSKRICELVKRRLKDAGLPSRLLPQSFRVTAITDLVTQGMAQ